MACKTKGGCRSEGNYTKPRPYTVILSIYNALSLHLSTLQLQCRNEALYIYLHYISYLSCLHTVVGCDSIELNTISYEILQTHTYTQPIQMVTSQHIPYLGNNLRVHLCGSIKAPDKIQVVIITNVLVVEGDIFCLWDQIGHFCWVR